VRRIRVQPTGPMRALNVTPLIDVVMCLIIFYLIVGQIVSVRRAEVDLPTARHGQSERPEEPLVINVTRAGDGTEIVVERAVVTASELDGLVRERLRLRRETVVQVRADRSLPYAAVSPVIAACREAGAVSVRLASEPMR